MTAQIKKTKKIKKTSLNGKTSAAKNASSSMKKLPAESRKTMEPKVSGKARASGKPKLISSKLDYKGRVFSVFSDTVEEPGGHTNVRDVIRHSGSVVILAVDERKNPADPDIILERQYRHAAGQVLIELPAGRVEPGEAPLAAAKREMIEETGYRARRWTLLTKYFASPGFLGEWMQIYLARDIREGDDAPEADENIEVFRMPLSEALALVEKKKIHDGKTLIGLMLYQAARQGGGF